MTDNTQNVTMQNSGLQTAQSFSVQSVAESSGPAISEVEEIHEVHKLLRTGEHAFKTRSFEDALHCYNEALEIDEMSVESYAGRAAVYVELGNYMLAQRDAEKVISMEPDNTQGHYLLGIALHNLGYFRESLLSFLKALDLDSDNHHVEVLTNNIATIASQICDISDELLGDVPNMDPYKKLTEVGSCLYVGKKYDTCIKVLTAAQKLETNQKGITMKVQLILANAHAALKHNELAISLYQECLSTAISAHDPSYQTKSLVSIASLFLELGDTQNAIVYYQKLLDLQRELQGEDLEAPLPEYWSRDLQCALHLNLSIAYKTIGSMRKAVTHAEIYCNLIKDYDPESRKNAEARSHQNVGMIYEILGEYQEALRHYQTYLKISKAKDGGDKSNVAQAYGCLGSAYAHLGNVNLALTYHDQHITMAKKLGNEKVLTTAHELLGDTQALLKQWEGAVESYMEMFSSCPRNDIRLQTTALCKLGQAYRKHNRFQYSIYYFEQAKQIAEEYRLSNARIMCEFNLACILQHSTQMVELDQARNYFLKLVPMFEGRLQQHYEEDTFCPAELREHLRHCYDGIQNVLAKLGNAGECLQYSESCKKKQITDLLQMQVVSGMKYNVNTILLYDAWTLEKMSRVVSQQNATVLYYHVLPTQVLLWVIQPGVGLVRFYSGKSPGLQEDYDQFLLKIIREIQCRRDVKAMRYECENRALALKDSELERVKQKNSKLSKSVANAKYREQLAQEVEEKELGKSGREKIKKERVESGKTAERRLFNSLIAPVDDLLSKMDEGSPLIIIPDKILYQCPFPVLKDWNGKRLDQRFRLSFCPSLYTMDAVVQNELNQLKLQDDLEFERTQARLGGLARNMQNIDFMRIAAGSPEILVPGAKSGLGLDSRNSTMETSLDLKRVSNPRLVTSGGRKFGMEGMGMSRESTLLSVRSKGSLASIKEAPSTPRLSKKGGGMYGSVPMVSFAGSTAGSTKPPTVSTKTLTTNATSIDKLLALHSLTTITTRTSTNTDITSSHQVVPQFKQVSDKDRCLVIGAPKLPKRLLLHGQPWQPATELRAAEAECSKVAEYCDVPAVVGADATKERFMKDIEGAAVIHIATFGCLKEKLLVFAPNVNREEGLPTMHSYIVSAEEIVQMKLVARLVVLSCACGPYNQDYIDEGFVLPAAFLMAGAQCVVSFLWSMPNKVMDKFYYHFYNELQKGCYVTKAISVATGELRKDDRYSETSYWSSPVVIGKDVYLSIKFIRHAQLDQTIDKLEAQVSEEVPQSQLNPVPLIPNLAEKESNLQTLQECIASLLSHHSQNQEVIVHVTSLIDDAIKRLHLSDINQRTVVLPAMLTECEGAMRLVKFLGFHFQPQSEHFSEPYVIFPHWNHDELMIPAFESLRAINELVESRACARAIHELLPTSQENISYLVDMLCITKHAQEIQLKVTDLSVRPLWKNKKVKALLYQLGYHQIGTLLYFNNVPSGRKLLTAALQLFIAISVHKTGVLLHKLDVNLLGGPASQKGSVASLEHIHLPSLTPMLLPRNQLRMSTPWLSSVEKAEEMSEKVKLSRNKSDVTSEYKFYVSKAKTWHQATVAAQAEESLNTAAQPPLTPKRVKVLPGGSSSRPRILVDHKRSLTLPETDQRRDYANFVLQQRLDNVSLRHQNDVRKLYMPYVINA